MPAPKLSVIIPTYNRARYLRLAIDSVLNQEGGIEYEVIVVDDGSTDNTPALLKKYGDAIKVLTLPHSGKPAAARNAGLSVAQGQLIAFQDSDDIWVKNKLKNQVGCFDGPGIVAAYGNAEYIDSRGKPANKLLIAGPGASGDVFAALIAKNKQPFPTSTLMARRRALDNIGGFNERLVIGTDTECWIRLSTQGKFRYQDMVLGQVRRSQDNISSIPSEGGWLKASYKHDINKAASYQGVIDNYPQLLSRAQNMQLLARLVEAYEVVAMSAKKLSLAREDEYKTRFHSSPRLRLRLFLRGKRTLYLTQGLRVIHRLHPPTHKKLLRLRDKLRARQQ